VKNMVGFSMHPGCERRAAYNLSISELIDEVVEEEVFDPEAGKTTDDPFPEELQDYSSSTVAELKVLCAERGLTVSGNKAELIARLEADDTSDSTEAPADEAAVEEEEAVPEQSAAAEDTEEGEVSESGGENGGNTTEE
jgi:hypothetical protein